MRYRLTIGALLAEMLVSNRDAIIARTRTRVAARNYPPTVDLEFAHGIPVFLDQLGAALRRAESTDAVDHDQIRTTAGQHGADLLRMGLTIAEVVHVYGDVCQTVTMLAIEQNLALSGAEFRVLNLCLDDAIAEAVTEYAHRHEGAVVAQGHERLSALAHELRNVLTTAMLTFDSIKSGRVALGGSTALLHMGSLTALNHLIDRALADVRLDGGVPHAERISVPEFIGEIGVGAALQATTRGVRLSVAPVDAAVTIEGDRQILAAAIANLVHNALAFTAAQGTVSLVTQVTPDRVMFEIADECGGLAAGEAESLLATVQQEARVLSGARLGISVAAKAATASHGELRVHDVPGHGCVFTLDLPRGTPAPLWVVGGGAQGRTPASGADELALRSAAKEALRRRFPPYPT